MKNSHILMGDFFDSHCSWKLGLPTHVGN